MKNEKTKLIIVITALLLLCTGLAVVGIILFKKDTNPQAELTSQNTQQQQMTSTEIIEKVKETPYIAETCYDGTVAIDPYLYETPFKRTNTYISNMDLKLKMGTEFLDEKRQLAYDYVKCLYDINSNDILSNPNNFIERFSSFYDDNVTFATDEADVTKEYYAEYLADNYVKNKAQIDAEFITDKSLVFYDNGIVYVRGYMQYTVNAYTDLDSLKKELKNSDLTIGTTYYVTTHVMLVPSMEDSLKYKILGLEF